MDNIKTDIVFLYILNNFFVGGSGKNKWSSFKHNGPMLAPKYEPHEIPIKYNGIEVKLSPEAEEYATLYAKYIDTEYIKNKTFNKNFFKSWKPLIKNTIIKSLDLCDFTDIHNYLLKQKENKMLMSKEEKEKIKEKQKKEEEKYKIAFVDNKQEEVGNFKIEPPGIFIGRGCHPKLGTVKKRILPKDITINISKDSPIPGNDKKMWAKIIHSRENEWLASWKDDITGKIKYVWLSNKSSFKSQSDEEKFDKARKLKKKINEIREINNGNLTSKDKKKRQLSTALYLIDTLALRVGNEKSDDEADTVGVTSLRYEHIILKDNNNIKLDFLGKDSVRYEKIFQVSEIIYENFNDFMKNKKVGDDIFELVKSSDINEYIKEFDEKLTAKVFRTFNASEIFEQELRQVTEKYEKYNGNDKKDLIMVGFNKAAAKVAILCNHQKNVSKNFNESLSKINDNIKKIEGKIKEIKYSLKEKEGKNKTSLKEKLIKLKEKLIKEKVRKEIKIEMKNISTTTSRDNYIDPRITIAFLKKNKIEFNKAFNERTLEKFKWALSVPENWVF